MYGTWSLILHFYWWQRKLKYIWKKQDFFNNTLYQKGPDDVDFTTNLLQATFCRNVSINFWKKYRDHQKYVEILRTNYSLHSCFPSLVFLSLEPAKVYPACCSWLMPVFTKTLKYFFYLLEVVRKRVKIAEKYCL